jgi:ATP-dependent RNA helicase DeaD
MPDFDFASLIGPELAGALTQRGFAGLTSVQEAVLDPALSDRDLRVTSQTGSGKTVAIGLALRHLVQGETASKGGAARPRAMVVAPTRELAHQVEQELTWLFAPLGVKVVTTTGGSSARDERRALGTGPAVIVGTPGRLLDHLSRKSIDASQVAAVVLDEADRMLDLGFREDLTAILGYPPAAHRTHLVSATFPHAVRALADSVQDNPAHVEGTRLGAANADIVHRIVLVDPKEQVGAVVNILLAKPDEQALVFARTRVDVASLAKELAAAKFAVGSLSGEMDQVARNRAMSAFKKGTLRVLVATDVAARGIDVQDIAHVIHADAPGDADTYTHRSGRTGRAGRKGMSSVLVTVSGLRQASARRGRARVVFQIESVPSAAEIRKAADERLWAELTAADPEGFEGAPDRVAALAARLAESPDVARTLARLLLRVRGAEASEPRELRHIEAPTERPRTGERLRPVSHTAPAHQRGRGAPVRESERTGFAEPGPTASEGHGGSSARPPRAPRKEHGGEWTPFNVTWGADHGADKRRLLAVVCRRGGIRGSDVGVIRVGPHSSTVDVASSVAPEFAEAAKVIDPREPMVIIRPDRAAVPAPSARPDAPREPRRPEGYRAPTRAEAFKERSPRAEHAKTPPPRADGHKPHARAEHPKAPSSRADVHKPHPRPSLPKAPPSRTDTHKPSAKDHGHKPPTKDHAHRPPPPTHGYKGRREVDAPARGGRAAPKRPKP